MAEEIIEILKSYKNNENNKLTRPNYGGKIIDNVNCSPHLKYLGEPVNVFLTMYIMDISSISEPDMVTYNQAWPSLTTPGGQGGHDSFLLGRGSEGSLVNDSIRKTRFWP